MLHVTQIGDYGVGRYLRNLVEVEVEAGWEVSVAGNPEGWLRDRAIDAGARWHDWTATRQPGPSTVREIWRLRSLIARVAPDVVHLHSSKAGLAGRLAVRRRTPTIFQPHGWSFFAAEGTRSRAALAWEQFATRWSDAVVCVSDAERAHGEGSGIAARWRVVPTAVDAARFAPGDRAAARIALDLGQEPTAICVSRLAIKHKAQDVLLDAWREVEAAVPGATLLLLGGGPDRAILERGASPAVRFLGERDDVATWMRAANVVVQPSRYEGLSMSVLEALACGRSVVVTDCVGMRESVADVGAVVPIDDREALAGALIVRLRDPGAADEEGARGRLRAVEQFSRVGWAQAMLDLTCDVARR
ncbi:MAG: hypothetical protein QOI47_1576 [Actinomycetota bacterium]|nr:hypothetical protein [Actinomycetota bacterium]